MKTFKEMKQYIQVHERFKAKPPMAGMHLTGFEGKLKLNQQSGHEDNHSDAVIKDFKAAVKIVDKHLKKLGYVAKKGEFKMSPFMSSFS